MAATTNVTERKIDYLVAGPFELQIFIAWQQNVVCLRVCTFSVDLAMLSVSNGLISIEICVFNRTNIKMTKKKQRLTNSILR